MTLEDLKEVEITQEEEYASADNNITEADKSQPLYPPNEAQEADEKLLQRNYSKEISVIIGYLLGVREDCLVAVNNGNPIDEILKEVNKTDSAKAIRHLNNLRSNIMLGFRSISRSIRINSLDYKPIYMNEYLEEDFKALSRMDINIATGRQDLNEYITLINKEISKRINDVKPLFPEWLEFKHIVFMFTMTGDLDAERERYQSNQNFYPYKRFFNWRYPQEHGNIIANDPKLLKIIYRNNNDYFVSYNKVTDASENVKKSINDFIQSGEKIQIFIDGENTDPYRFAATIDGLQNYEIEKIDKIIVYYDSVYSSRAWTYLKHFTFGVDIEAVAVERIKENKSLVDHKLVAGVSKAVYKDGVDSVILASSDSDFWSVIEDVSANYLVMVETDKCSYDFKDILRKNNIFYCYLDKFIVPEDDKYFKMVFKKELVKTIEEQINLPDPKEIFNHSLMQTRASIPPAEANSLFEKYISRLSLKINKQGQFEIVIPE